MDVRKLGYIATGIAALGLAGLIAKMVFSTSRIEGKVIEGRVVSERLLEQPNFGFIYRVEIRDSNCNVRPFVVVGEKQVLRSLEDRIDIGDEVSIIDKGHIYSLSLDRVIPTSLITKKAEKDGVVLSNEMVIPYCKVRDILPFDFGNIYVIDPGLGSQYYFQIFDEGDRKPYFYQEITLKNEKRKTMEGPTKIAKCFELEYKYVGKSFPIWETIVFRVPNQYGEVLRKLCTAEEKKQQIPDR